jgi:hypothetical protein
MDRIFGLLRKWLTTPDHWKKIAASVTLRPYSLGSGQ